MKQWGAYEEDVTVIELPYNRETVVAIYDAIGDY